jgi:hypothetical protein
MSKGNYIVKDKGSIISDNEALRAHTVANRIVRKILTESGTHYILTPDEYNDAVVYLTKKMIGVK